MAKLSTNRIAWTYTDDQGNEWRVAAQKALTDQGVLGGVAAASTVPQRPEAYKMRRMTFSDGSGHSRVLPIYKPDATATTAGTSINCNFVDDQHAVTSSGRLIPEGLPRPNVTKQSA